MFDTRKHIFVAPPSRNCYQTFCFNQSTTWVCANHADSVTSLPVCESGPDMTGRRRFIVLGCALAAGSFIQGNFLQIRKTVDHSGSKFVGPPAPQSGGHSVIGNVESSTSIPADAKSVVRKYNTPQIRDLHPDHVIADNVAPTISESHPQPLKEIVITESERMVFEAALIRLSKLQSYVG